MFGDIQSGDALLVGKNGEWHHISEYMNAIGYEFV